LLRPFLANRRTPERLNADPSTSLRTSARGSDAARTPQLYKKEGSFRSSVRGVGFIGVRCERIQNGLVRSVRIGLTVWPRGMPGQAGQAHVCLWISVRRLTAMNRGTHAKRLKGILRLRSGFRLAARTPRKRLKIPRPALRDPTARRGGAGFRLRTLTPSAGADGYPETTRSSRVAGSLTSA
jgi:hypothetical protein